MGNYREQFEELVNKLLRGKNKDDFLLLLDSFDTRDKLFHALLEDFKKSEDLLHEQFQSQYNRCDVREYCQGLNSQGSIL